MELEEVMKSLAEIYLREAIGEAISKAEESLKLCSKLSKIGDLNTKALAYFKEREVEALETLNKLRNIYSTDFFPILEDKINE